MERFSSFLVVILILPTIVKCQFGLSPSNYIERQLLCALDRAPCDSLGGQIKEALPIVIGTNCARCDRRQYTSMLRVARFVQNRYPEVWQALIEKYSPPNT